MSEEEQVVEMGASGEPTGAESVEGAAKEGQPVTEEIKVQAQDLLKTINDIIREGTARRVKVFHGERVLVDIPLVAGAAAGLVLAIYMPYLSAIVGVAALLGGCTVRIEREEPPAET